MHAEYEVPVTDRMLTSHQAERPRSVRRDAARAGTAAYAGHGFAPDKRQHYHQGGFSGFQPHEFPTHTSCTTPLPPHSVVAWNVSGDG